MILILMVGGLEILNEISLRAMGSSCSKLVVCLCWEKVTSWFDISTARKISLTYELG